MYRPNNIDPLSFWFSRLGEHLLTEGRLSQFATDRVAEDQYAEKTVMASFPHAEPGKKNTRMGGSEPARFLISDERAEAWAPIALPEQAAGFVTMHRTADRKPTDWMVDILMHPPEGVFLAASIGRPLSHVGNWGMTFNSTFIIFGGEPKLQDGRGQVGIDRVRFLEARDWFIHHGKILADLLSRESILSDFRAGRLTPEAARKKRAQVKTPDEILRSYPGSHDATALRLANYAAHYWQPANSKGSLA